MKLTIRPITIHDGPLFIEFMDSLSFSHQPLWKGCYCRYYHTDCSQPDWNKRSEEMNKQEALNAIDAGLMHGYLAFDQDTPIGWLNAGHWENYPRLKSDLSQWADPDTALLICFLIKEDYRNQGIATSLLEFAERDLKGLGYTQVLSVPVDDVKVSESQYRGPKSLYEKKGYQVRTIIDNVVIMGKTL